MPSLVISTLYGTKMTEADEEKKDKVSFSVRKRSMHSLLGWIGWWDGDMYMRRMVRVG